MFAERADKAAVRGQFDEPDFRQGFLLGLAAFEPEPFERNVDALRRRLGEIPGKVEKETLAIRTRFTDAQPRCLPVTVTSLVPRRLR